MKWLLCVVMVVLAGVVRADEIRWINPQGGDWNEPGNWDLGRVPVQGDTVVFDQDAEFTVSLVAPGQAGLVRVTSGDISFDLGGYSLVNATESGDGLDVTASTTRVSVRFANGQVLHDPSGEANVLIDSLSEHASIVAISESASFGPGGLSLHVGVGGSLELNGSAWHGDSPSVDGNLRIYGEVDFASYIWGCGKIEVMDGSVLRVGLDISISSLSVYGSGKVYCEDIEGCPSGVFVDGQSSISVLEVFNTRFCVGVEGFEIQYIGSFESFNYYDVEWSLAVDASLGPVVRAGLGAKDFGGTVTIELFGEIPEFPGLVHIAEIGSPRPNSGDKFDDPCILGSVVGQAAIDRQFYLVEQFDGTWLLAVPMGWCAADLNFNGRLDFFDVALFLQLFNQESPWANANRRGGHDFFDVAEFLAIYTGGCP